MRSLWAGLLAMLLLTLSLFAPACDAQCALPHTACHAIAADCSMHPAQAHLHGAPMAHVCAPDVVLPSEQQHAAPPLQARAQAVPLAASGFQPAAREPAPALPHVLRPTPLRI